MRREIKDTTSQVTKNMAATAQETNMENCSLMKKK